MLLIKTELKQSSIQGIGLFTKEPIKSGQITWSWTDGIDLEISLEKLESSPESFKIFMQRYGWKTICNTWRLSVDEERFTNHSYTPNLYCPFSLATIVTALRDINIGEELAVNYKSFDCDFDKYKNLLV